MITLEGHETMVGNRHAMSVRVLSISATLRWHISARRRPVAYSIIIMVRCIRLLAESISRATSCWSSMVGSRR